MNPSEIPTFFVPDTKLDSRDARYAHYAAWCGRTVPTLDRRIYSIAFVHDGQEWTATVGETLHGVQCNTMLRGIKIDSSRPVGDPAVVLAIFPGTPFMVVTNHRIDGRIRSAWENPFLAGEPKSVTYFTMTK